MNATQDRVEVVFNAAVEKASATERSAYLDGACGSDADLRVQVEVLLEAHEQAGSFLISPEVDEPDEGPGARIGRYKILQKIGEGGFGVVYMADQEEPIRRKVALKVIKLGMDTKQVIARFEAERQALALMEHPNIAKVFDAGATERGRPYFVMELVKGVPVTQYCDRNNLDTRQRLELFLDVCGAVQHAHQKGIIHRDLKPQNVMVTLHDGQPVPKVIDFGISKATNQRLTEKTLFTEYHQFIGTPQYMSPEQAEMSGLDIDTRSDVYSLGALLYELLTGTPPFEIKTLSEAGYGEIQRIIREVEPPKPSTRLATLVARDTELARQHGSENRSLPGLIQGDLDWIVMKAMEKDRTRRYGTAFEFATDIRRHLNDEPVAAGAPSISYQARKFVLRHRYGVVASTVVFVVLMLGCLFTTIGFVQASRERDAAHESKAEADKQAARSKAIADFLQDMLVATQHNHATGLDVDVKKVVTTAREVFGNDHATVAATLSTLAAQLQSRGSYEDAEPLYRESLRIWKKHFGDDHVNVGLTLSRLGTLLHIKGEAREAEITLRKSLQITKSQGAADSLAASETWIFLADALQNRGDYPGAEAALRESLRIRRKAAPHQTFQIAITLNLLANVLAMGGEKDALGPVLLECLDAFKKVLPEGSNVVAKVSLGAGEYYLGRGELDESEAHLREALRIYHERETPSIMFRDIALRLLATIIKRRDDGSQKYIPVRAKFLNYVRKNLGSNNPTLRTYLASHASYLVSKERPTDAIPLILEGLELPKKKGEGDRTFTKLVTTLTGAAVELAMSEKRKPADYKLALSATKVCLKKKPQDPMIPVLAGMLHYRLGEFQMALTAVEAARALFKQTRTPVHPSVEGVAAMVNHRLKRENEAAAAYARLRAAATTGKNADNQELQALLKEVETLLGPPKASR